MAICRCGCITFQLDIQYENNKYNYCFLITEPYIMMDKQIIFGSRMQKIIDRKMNNRCFVKKMRR